MAKNIYGLNPEALNDVDFKHTLELNAYPSTAKSGILLSLGKTGDCFIYGKLRVDQHSASTALQNLQFRICNITVDYDMLETDAKSITATMYNDQEDLKGNWFIYFPFATGASSHIYANLDLIITTTNNTNRIALTDQNMSLVDVAPLVDSSSLFPRLSNAKKDISSLVFANTGGTSIDLSGYASKSDLDPTLLAKGDYSRQKTGYDKHELFKLDLSSLINNSQDGASLDMELLVCGTHNNGTAGHFNVTYRLQALCPSSTSTALYKLSLDDAYVKVGNNDGYSGQLYIIPPYTTSQSDDGATTFYDIDNSGQIYTIAIQTYQWARVHWELRYCIPTMQSNRPIIDTSKTGLDDVSSIINSMAIYETANPVKKDEPWTWLNGKVYKFGDGTRGVRFTGTSTTNTLNLRKQGGWNIVKIGGYWQPEGSTGKKISWGSSYTANNATYMSMCYIEGNAINFSASDSGKNGNYDIWAIYSISADYVDDYSKNAY